MCQKSKKWDRSLAWLSRDLSLQLRWKKKKVYGHWKRGWTTWEDCRDAIFNCRDKICVPKDQLELKLASTAGDNKIGF